MSLESLEKLSIENKAYPPSPKVSFVPHETLILKLYHKHASIVSWLSHVMENATIVHPFFGQNILPVPLV